MGNYTLLCFLFVACNRSTAPDLEAEKKEILRLEALQRQYHFTKNAGDFVKLFSREFISINKGKISKPTQEENSQRFEAYFKAVEFIKWDNKAEPLVRFSADGSLAYVAVDKLVILQEPGPEGKLLTDTTEFAWLTIYKKEGSSWKIDCVTSTNK
jgi:hypothetical protein